MNFQPLSSQMAIDAVVNSLEFRPSHQTLLPVADIIDGKVNQASELLFCYQIAIEMIEAIVKGQYSAFDILTTTNCCHGISIFARYLFLEVVELDLKALLVEGKDKITELNADHSQRLSCRWYLPKPLIELAQLFILSYIKEPDPQRRWRTEVNKLKETAPIGSKKCKQIVATLQTHYSNQVAESYYSHFKKLPDDMRINGMHVSAWGQYLHADYIRKDKRGRKYASCMFSMQVSLAHLIQREAKIALIVDIRSKLGEVKGRYVQLFQGDGVNLVPIEDAEDELEPIVVFGVCVYSDELNEESFEFLMNPWLSRLSELVLACDTHYPQFPNVGDDPEFDHSPIVPEEMVLKKIIDKYSKIPGVSAKDPSFFCLSHIYPASVKEILSGSLPRSFIPEVARRGK